MLYKENNFAYAERQDPKFPFKFMKIVWLYTQKSEGVEMTWIQHFEMEKDFKFNDTQIEGFINEGSQHNLKIFKKIIEQEAGN